MSRRLPRGLERLLGWALPSDLREPITGDLQEDYAARIDRGRWRAAAAAWWTAGRLVLPFVWDRLSGGRGLPPIGDEIPRRLSLLDSLRQDLVFGARVLRRQPGFALTVILVLALGIGADTVIFSVVDAVLWRRLPLPSGEAVVALGEQRPKEQRDFGPVSPPDLADWDRDNTTLVSMAGFTYQRINLTGQGDPERVQAIQVSPSFLSTLGVSPARGRDFAVDENRPGHAPVVVISDGFWRRHLGGAADAVGRTVAINSVSHTIIGILPREFWWRLHPDLLLPLEIPSALTAPRNAHFFQAIGRRRDGVSLEQVRADFDRIGRSLEQQFPQLNNGHLPRVIPLRESLVGTVQSAMLMALAAVTCVLLIVCANVAMLLVARSTGRQHEMAVRVALGAGRGRVVQQLLTESLMLGAIGGVAGVLLAQAGLAALRNLLPVEYTTLPGIDTLAVDGRALAIALGTTLLTGLAFGAISALTVSQRRAGASLNQTAHGAIGHARGTRIRSTLVVSEVALSLVLLVGAGLLMASFWRLTRVQPGFRAENLVSMETSLPASRYPDRVRMRTFYDPLLARLQSLPHVTAVGAVSALPFSGQDIRSNFTVEGRVVDPMAIPSRIHPRVVTPGYLSAIAVPLVRGRLLNERDGSDTVPVAVINQSAAATYWDGVDPIGKRFSFPAAPRVWIEIVGIVGNIRHWGLERDLEPEAYLAFFQPTVFAQLGPAMAVVVRTDQDVESMAPMLRSAVYEIDPNQPVERIRSVETAIEESVASRKLSLWLLTVFSIVAVLVTASGLYGVMAFLVHERRREIGVRRALGASGPEILILIVRQAARMTAGGVVVGLALAVALSRYVQSLLFGVEPRNLPIYAAVTALLVAVAFLACIVPSLRALRIDPLTALREP